MTPSQHLTWDSRPGADGSTVHLPKYSEAAEVVEVVEPVPVVITFVVPGQPVPKGRPRLALKGHVYTPPRTAEAEQRILAYLKAAWPHLKPLTGRIGVVVRFYAAGGRFSDIDNLTKTVLDAGHGALWLNDNQIDDLKATVYRHSGNPRTEVLVFAMPDLGRDSGEGFSG